MSSILRLSARFALALCLFAPVAWADDIGAVIPADAKVVVAVHNITAAADHVRAFAEAIGVPIPAVFDVAQLSALTGLGETWPLDRGAALVVMETNEKGVAIVFPVSDVKAALAKLGGKDGTGESVNFPPGKQAYGLAKGNYLVISPNADILAKFKSPAKTLGAEFTKDASETDFYVLANIANLRPMIEPLLQQAEAQISNLPIPPGQGDPEQTTALLKWYLSGIGKMVQQTDGIYLSLTVAKDKVALEAMAEFTEGSYCAKNLGNIPKAANALKGVPAGPYMMAVGMDSQGYKQVMLDMSESMLSLPALSRNITAEQRKKSFAAMRTLLDLAQGFGMSMSMGDKAVTMAGTYNSDSPEKLQSAIHETVESMQAMMTAMSPGLSGKWSRRTAGDVEVEEFVYDFSKMPEQQKQMIEAMYGADAKMQIGIVDGALRFAMGSKDPILAFKNSPKQLSDDPGVKAVLEDLPKGAPAIILIDAFGYARAIAKIVANGPVPIPIPSLPIPESSPPPIGVAITGKKNSMIKDVVIRAETVKALVTAVHKAMSQGGAPQAPPL